jgi:hypothetical protein
MKRRKQTKDKPLIAMDRDELRETLRDIGAEMNEGLLDEARSATSSEILIAAAVLHRPGQPDRLVFNHPEAGDGFGTSMIEEFIEECRHLPRPGEALAFEMRRVEWSQMQPLENIPLFEMDRQERCGTSDDDRRRRMLEEARAARQNEILIAGAVLGRPGQPDRLSYRHLEEGDGTGIHAATEFLDDCQHLHQLKPEETLRFEIRRILWEQMTLLTPDEVEEVFM